MSVCERAHVCECVCAHVCEHMCVRLCAYVCESMYIHAATGMSAGGRLSALPIDVECPSSFD